MFWFFVITLGVAWILQSVLSFRQAKAFSALFVALRRKGKVAMGKFRGGFVAGSIVMFVLDEEGRVIEGHRLGGVTVLARFKSFDTYDGQYVSTLDPKAAARFGKSTAKAVANAVETYHIVMSGGEAPEPPTALSRMLGKLPGITPKKRALPQLAPDGRSASGFSRPVGDAPSRWRRRVPVS